MLKKFISSENTVIKIVALEILWLLFQTHLILKIQNFPFFIQGVKPGLHGLQNEG